MWTRQAGRAQNELGSLSGAPLDAASGIGGGVSSGVAARPPSEGRPMHNSNSVPRWAVPTSLRAVRGDYKV